MENKKFDLEDRLIKFACMCLDVCDLLPNTKTGQNLKYQLSKSSTFLFLIFYFMKYLFYQLPRKPHQFSFRNLCIVSCLN
jgi:hypothetical protein